MLLCLGLLFRFIPEKMGRQEQGGVQIISFPTLSCFALRAMTGSEFVWLLAILIEIHHKLLKLCGANKKNKYNRYRILLCKPLSAIGKQEI